MINKAASISVAFSILMALPAFAGEPARRKSRPFRPPITEPPHAVRSEADRRRDPLGIIQRQGVSSLYGGMGNMGGGSGRSANTGIGLGAHGNSQGPRF
ncbi:hypothetical protein ASF60_21370 [Methylobacterium sp. Leaf113]|uniref:hypothetical protein n=1 Tax=Methylobacterium sp. Leaf113 TaxID=1736259 RepID=UPI0006F63716|nr:hypothetical protein [Methylobacterium sp. Leaf113]KQP86565.1 hypothetical protein ASF60_21370 [Methylobacterium sp. Leaf113]